MLEILSRKPITIHYANLRMYLVNDELVGWISRRWYFSNSPICFQCVPYYFKSNVYLARLDFKGRSLTDRFRNTNENYFKSEFFEIIRAVRHLLTDSPVYFQINEPCGHFFFEAIKLYFFRLVPTGKRIGVQY